MNNTDPTISERHIQILALVAEGMTNAQIGAELHLSRHTVNTHLKDFYRRFGANDRAHAVLLAMRAGVLR
ncbi:MAG: helix-turn-helix transcriptional regulator [Nocardioides sp.]|nr:helix-turn-helix transcriptional regulator [Nocardioides sp.]